MNDDTDTPLMILAAVRYALPRHSYMVGTAQDYIKRHWKSISKYHWTILTDIKEYINETNISNKDYMHLMDLNSWIGTYNYLIQQKDTYLPLPEHKRLLEPIPYID